MGKEVLAVCGKEKAYTERMYEYILKSYGEDFEIVLFTDEDDFEVYVSNNPVDVVIAEENFCVESSNVTTKIVLSEEPGRKEAVYKYMSCDRILNEVMAICAAGKKAARVKKQREGKSVIGIYTPIKRSFQTTFAITLGQILAKNHKVLYLNFESYSGFECLTRGNCQKDVMDLVYFSECSDGDFMYRLNSMKDHIGNLDYIYPIKSFLSYSEVSKEQWQRLINNILEKTDYEIIILDLSEQVNGLLNILKMCTNIYTITDSERIASAKVAQYENLLRLNSFEDVLEKTENIEIPKFREIPTDFTMLPYSELADYIKRMIDYDYNGIANDT